MKRKITQDVYNIANRIKDIDSGYFIVYDTLCGHFEVHNRFQYDTTYCITLPYDTLDERTLQYVYKTMSTNIENIIEDIDNHNLRCENAEKSCVLSRFNESIEEMMKGVNYEFV